MSRAHGMSPDVPKASDSTARRPVHPDGRRGSWRPAHHMWRSSLAKHVEWEDATKGEGMSYGWQWWSDVKLQKPGLIHHVVACVCAWDWGVVFVEPESFEMRCESMWVQFSNMVHTTLDLCQKKRSDFRPPFLVLGCRSHTLEKTLSTTGQRTHGFDRRGTWHLDTFKFNILQ